MSSAEAARQARRRKILARGSDRLAFITGEVPPIPPPISSSETALPPSESDAPSSTRDASPVILLDESPSVSNHQESEALTPVELQYIGQELSRALEESRNSSEAEEGTDLSPPSFRSSENLGLLASLDQALSGMGNGFTSGGLSTPSSTSSTSSASSLALSGITHSIDATQNFRITGALLLGLLALVKVFFLCNGLEGRACGNWAGLWPVVLVILTDVTLVLGALLLGFVKIPQMTQVDVSQFSSGQDEIDKISGISSKLGSGLEVGSVIQKSTKALYLDCSFYVVTLISGYTLGQRWQWAFLK